MKKEDLEEIYAEEGKTKVLVTGSEGFVGSRLSKILEEKGYDVIRTDIKTKSKFIPDNFIYADLTKQQNFPCVKDVDIIFHVASIFDYSVPFMRLYEVNVLGTLNLIEEAIKAGVKRMILFSSAAVYGECDPEWYDLPIREDWERSWLNDNYGGDYDLSKRLQEITALCLAKHHDFHLQVIRPAPIYGAGSSYGMYDLIRMVKEHKIGAIPRNFHKKALPMVHIDDVCNAAIFLAEKPFAIKYESYNVCDDYNLDMIDTLRYIAHLTDSKIKILVPIHPKILKLFKPFMKLLAKLSAWIARKFRDHARPRLEADTLNYMFGNYLFSNRKIKTTGFRFKYADRREGLLKVIGWYKRNRWKK